MENQEMANWRKELAAEGQKNLENAVEAAFEFLSTMNEGLCNSAVWSKPEASRSYYAPCKARRRFRAALASVHAIFNAIPYSNMDHFELVRQSLRSPHLNASGVCVVQEIVGGGAAASQEGEAQINKLEEQASNMRMTLSKTREREGRILIDYFTNKNRHLKHLIDQFGDLITDISTWQSPYPPLVTYAAYKTTKKGLKVSI
ncbi:hypothetical protein Cgig2_024102 [Carnegiea gigantea]|uniref:Uncharacterized protein n=1 Tax=Carnegiea gigantea TaxID=171969 RepID=A0A9Q1GWW2_9CARY|nr:hypothetical protein Cgig2_024102 [Carnegiea gigantea]